MNKKNTITDPVTGEMLIVRKTGEAPPPVYSKGTVSAIAMKHELGKRFKHDQIAVSVLEKQVRELGNDSAIGTRVKVFLKTHGSLDIAINEADAKIKRDSTMTHAMQLLKRKEMVEQKLGSVDKDLASIVQEVDAEANKWHKELYTSNIDKVPLRMELSVRVLDAVSKGTSPYEIMRSPEGGRLMLHLREQFPFLLPEKVKEIASVDELKAAGNEYHTPEAHRALERTMSLREGLKTFVSGLISSKSSFLNDKVISHIERNMIGGRR